MAEELDGKVAFITGAARGQGRSHAVRLAQEGADIIAVDLCGPIDSVEYDLSSEDDLALTAKLVNETGRRIVTRVADVRDETGLGAALQDGTDQGEGGAIVITSSTAGLKGLTNGSAGSLGYLAAKHAVVGLMRGWAVTLAPHKVRVNTVHPTGVNTPMVVNDAFAAFAMENPETVALMQNLLPVDLVEPEDVSNAVLFLVGESGRYVTGQTLGIDAGYIVR